MATGSYTVVSSH